MHGTASNPLPAFGFLTSVEDPEHGYFGGYLILSELGRPLEFHCSTPVKPNPAQRILYGTTLREYVLGELIGQALLAKAQIPVQAVLTDQRDMLSTTLVRSEAIALLEPLTEGQPETPPTVAPTTAPEILVDRFRLVGSDTCRWSPEHLAESLKSLSRHIDLDEPFGRIVEAIREAQRMMQESVNDSHEFKTAA